MVDNSLPVWNMRMSFIIFSSCIVLCVLLVSINGEEDVTSTISNTLSPSVTFRPSASLSVNPREQNVTPRRIQSRQSQGYGNYWQPNYLNWQYDPYGRYSNWQYQYGQNPYWQYQYGQNPYWQYQYSPYGGGYGSAGSYGYGSPGSYGYYSYPPYNTNYGSYNYNKGSYPYPVYPAPIGKGYGR